MIDQASEIGGDEQQTRQDAEHECGGLGADALARAIGHVGLVLSGCAQQRSEVVGQDLGGDVHQESLQGQARDAFQVQAMLDEFEGFLDASALVVLGGAGAAYLLFHHRPLVEVVDVEVVKYQSMVKNMST